MWPKCGLSGLVLEASAIPSDIPVEAFKYDVAMMPTTNGEMPGPGSVSIERGGPDAVVAKAGVDRVRAAAEFDADGIGVVPSVHNGVAGGDEAIDEHVRRLNAVVGVIAPPNGADRLGIGCVSA